MADCCWWPMLRQNRSFMVIKSIEVEFLPAKYMGLVVNTINGDVMGLTEWSEHRAFEERWSNLCRRLGDRRLASVTLIRTCTFPNVIRIVNRGTAAIHRKYRSSNVNESIAISIIDRNIHRWITAKLKFSRERRLIRSVASDCLTNNDKECLTICVTCRVMSVVD